MRDCRAGELPFWAVRHFGLSLRLEHSNNHCVKGEGQLEDNRASLFGDCGELQYFIIPFVVPNTKQAFIQ